MQDHSTFGALSKPKSLSLVLSYKRNPKFFQKLYLETKSQLFGVWKNTYHTIFINGKMLIIEFSYSFLYIWSCLKLYDKKFLVYGNCMIRSFGQPGKFGQYQISKFKSCEINRTN